jgi:hypothetical protein
MVIFEREDPAGSDEKKSVIYVASGNKLYWYAKDQNDQTAKWNLDEYAIDQPSGKIIDLAATKSYLYALCLDGHGLDTSLWRIGSSDNKWTPVNFEKSEYPLVQSIFADPETDRLFAGAGKDDKDKATYAILYLENDTISNTLDLLESDTTILSGVVFRDDVYYLSTRGAGIYAQGADGTASPLDDGSDNKNNNRTFMGIIKLGDGTIIAIERNNGVLYEVNEGQFQQIKYTGGDVIQTNGFATGAMAIWKGSDKGTDVEMLIIGKQGSLSYTTTSSYTHGYVEFHLTGVGGTLDTTKPRRDPGNLLSVDDNDRYRATMGKHPINYLFQAPEKIDDNMTFFAATQTAGLWSYKERPNGGLQWNAEN